MPKDVATQRRTGRPSSAGRPAAGIQSVEIAFSVLDMMRGADGPLSLTQISELTGLSPSKLHRYLVSLGRCGLIAQSSISGRYDLGPAAVTIGAVALKRFDGFALVDEEVTVLADALSCSAFIYIWIDTGPVLIKTLSPARFEFMLRLGSSIPLVGSACGPVFLAYLPDEVVQPVLRRNINQSQQAQRKPLRDRAIETLKRKVRGEPVYWEPKSILFGHGAGAAPIFDAEGKLFCVVGLAMANNDPSEIERGKNGLAMLASALSLKLGYNRAAAD